MPIAAAVISGVASADAVNIIVLAGQSNMVGGGTIDELDASLQLWVDPMPEVPFRQWLNGSEYGLLQWDAHLEPRGVHFGPEMSLLHRLVEARPQEAFAVIKVAYDGTNLGCSWLPDGCGLHLYQKLRLIGTYWREDFEASGLACRLAGVIWVQGEADSRSEWTAQRYYDNLKALVEQLRIDWHRPGLPFIAARVHPRAEDFVYGDLVRQAMRDFATEDPYMDSVGVSDLPLREDQVHLSSESMVRLGIRLADALVGVGAIDDDTSAPPCVGDVSANGSVGIEDVLELLAHWGPCVP